MPKIGEPVLTIPTDEFLERVKIDIPESQTIPELSESELPRLDDFDDVENVWIDIVR